MAALFDCTTDNISITVMDYNKNAPETKEFFAKVQNKLHFAIHGHTTAEVTYERTRDFDRDSSLPHCLPCANKG